MENEKDFIEVKATEDDVEVLSENGEPVVDSKKPSIFRRAWNSVKRFPGKHPKITAGLAVVGGAALGYLLGHKFNEASDDDGDNEENYGKLEFFNGENDVDGNETEEEEFSFTEVDNDEEAI